MSSLEPPFSKVFYERRVAAVLTDWLKAVRSLLGVVLAVPVFQRAGGYRGPCWSAGSDTWCRKLSSELYSNGVFPTSDASRAVVVAMQMTNRQVPAPTCGSSPTPLASGLAGSARATLMRNWTLSCAPTGARGLVHGTSLRAPNSLPTFHRIFPVLRRSPASTSPVPSGMGKVDVNDRETPTGPRAVYAVGHRWRWNRGVN